MNTTELTSRLDLLCAKLCDAEAEGVTNLKHAQTMRQPIPSKTFQNERLHG